MLCKIDRSHHYSMCSQNNEGVNNSSPLSAKSEVFTQCVKLADLKFKPVYVSFMTSHFTFQQKQTAVNAWKANSWSLITAEWRNTTTFSGNYLGLSKLLCNDKRQYLLTCKVIRYCLLALHSSTFQYINHAKWHWCNLWKTKLKVFKKTTGVALKGSQQRHKKDNYSFY